MGDEFTEADLLELAAKPLWKLGDPYPADWLPATVLHLSENNPRRGDVPKIAESIQEQGWFGRLIVQAYSPRQGTSRVLKGNHSFQAGTSVGMTAFPCEVLDVDDVEGDKIMVGDNRYAELATWEDRILAEVLVPLPDLLGTGYTDVDLQALLSSLEMPDDPEPPEGRAPAAEVRVQVGTVSFTITREEWDAFEGKLSNDAGNRHEDQVAWVRASLGL